MRLLIVGSTGLLGSAIGAHLGARGHEIVGTRRPGSAALDFEWLRGTIPIDVARASSKDWVAHLGGIDLVINCVGGLQDGPSGSLEDIHATGADALFAACEKAGVRRVFHFSAIGVDRHQLSDFSRSKLQGERALTARDLDWVILRPSVVLGRQVYGASAQFRGLSALPIVPKIENGGPLQVVQLSDVLKTVTHLVDHSEIKRAALDLAGPERLSFDEIVAIYRRWHGWRPAQAVRLPGWLLNLGFRAGDLAGRLGWRPAMRSNAQREITAGAVGDPAPWTELTGIRPISLCEALRAEPATVQDRWYAKLFFLKPISLIVFAAFWMFTGLISIGPGYQIGLNHMREGNAGIFSVPAVIGGGLADIAIGVAILIRPTARMGLIAAIVISVTYAIIGTALLPALWIEPLGPMAKIWPIIVLNLFLLATLRGR